jgi:hypothetical protein
MIYPIKELKTFVTNWGKIVNGFPEATHFIFKQNRDGDKVIWILKDTDKASWAYEITDAPHPHWFNRINDV